MTYFYLFIIILIICACFDIFTRRFLLLPIAIAAIAALILFLTGQSDIVIWGAFLAIPTLIYVVILRNKK